MNLNIFISILTNFKIQFSNKIDSPLREITVSNMPLEMRVGDYIYEYKEIVLEDNRVVIKLI